MKLPFFVQKLIKTNQQSIPGEQSERIDIPMTLENQNEKIANICDKDIENYLEEMFMDYDQFVILAPETAINEISFVQACQVDDMINIQLGLEERNGSKLVEIYCSKRECVDIFLHFYATGRIENMEHYTPVQMM